MRRLLLRLALARVSQPHNVLLLAALTAVGVVLLSGLAVAHAVAAQGERAGMRSIEGPAGVASSAVDFQSDGRTVTLVAIYDVPSIVRATGLPADLFPDPGHVQVSPALSDQLDQSGTAAQVIQARLPQGPREAAAPELLLHPDEMVAYVGMPEETPPPHHAATSPPRTLGGPITVLVVTMVLLGPAVTMLVAAARFDSRRRLALLIELRVLGARKGALGVLAAAEAVLVAVAAGLLAWAAWMLGVRHAVAAGLPGAVFFVSDLALPAVWVLGVVVVVAIAAATASQSLLDGLDGRTPSRQTTARSGVVALVAGVVGLHLVVLAAPQLDDTQLGILELVSLGLAVTGLVRVAPTLVGHVGRWIAARGRGPEALLGGRRLQFEAAQATRAGAGVMVVAFAFGGFASLDLGPVTEGTPPQTVSTSSRDERLHTIDLNGQEAEPLVHAVEDRGLTPAPIAYRRVEHTSLVAFTTCEALRTGLKASTEPRDAGCAHGRALRTPAATHRALGSLVDLEEKLPRLPQQVPIVAEVHLPGDHRLLDGLDVVVPVAAETLQLAQPTRVVTQISSPRERLDMLAAVAEAAPLSVVRAVGDPLAADDGLETVASLGRMTLVAALVLAGAGLALTTADAALRRRETAAFLFASGAPASTRRRMVALEVGVPLLLAVTVAAGLGFELVFVGGRLIGGDVQVPWVDLGLAVGSALLVAAAATLTAMFFVSRIPTESVLRAEH